MQFPLKSKKPLQQMKKSYQTMTFYLEIIPREECILLESLLCQKINVGSHDFAISYSCRWNYTKGGTKPKIYFCPYSSCFIFIKSYFPSTPSSVMLLHPEIIILLLYNSNASLNSLTNSFPPYWFSHSASLSDHTVLLIPTSYSPHSHLSHNFSIIYNFIHSSLSWTLKERE